MAEEAVEQEAATGGGKKNVIIFVIALMVAVGASVGGTVFFLSSGEETVEVEPVEAASSKPKTAIYHNMRPPYIVNYLTGSKPRYLQAEFTIMARNEAAIEAVILHMPLIRSEIVSYLSEQNFLELQTQEGKEAVRRGIVDLVNRVLATYDVSPGIESALFTNFVLQ
ncbi:MAG: flagellar basal body-associated FliL family protein [Pseudomonadaceae bacterium]|nr:flagellar basal body-associated FliL family protein [Pseudomonadaceae bacterium]